MEIVAAAAGGLRAVVSTRPPSEATGAQARALMAGGVDALSLSRDGGARFDDVADPPGGDRVDLPADAFACADVAAIEV